ncbi:MAG TPA: SRPBCC family protein [Deinococcales bacterium]|nr:SRPBCC family protein [Deinococcales bacterium]
MTQQQATSPDAGEVTKWSLVAAGLAAALIGLRMKGAGGLALMVGGGALAAAAASGKAGVVVQGARNEHPKAIKVVRSVTLNRPSGEVYAFWRQLSNLPQFMEHLESVQEYDERRSTWVAKAPAGTSVRWEAEVTEERPGEVIAWRSLEGSEVPNDGRVTFSDLPAGRGTLVRVTLNYTPPAGPVGRVVAKLFGEEPYKSIGNDLRRLKWILEAREAPTHTGQASGRKARGGLLIGAPGPL